MARVIEGNLIGTGKRFAIVAGRFNSFVGESLIAGAIDTLVRHGVADDDIVVVRCPGSFELPQTAQRVLGSQKVDALLCVGVLIRGGTSHFDWIAGQATRGIAEVGQRTGVPVVYGLLTCDTLEQAIERAGTKAGNKGAEAAMAALEMADLYAKLSSE
jgi:6,7-dimethyl-8-ribityllumazine synthase